MAHLNAPVKPAVKICLYGVEGIGKSTFASKFPKPVFSDTEGSTKFMTVDRLPPDRVTSWTMLKEYAAFVKSRPDLMDTYIIDTGDWAERLCMTHICDSRKVSGIEDFGYGKGYTYLEEEFGRYLNMLEEIVESGTNVVIVCHAQLRKFEQPDELGAYDRYELKLEKKTAALVKEWADLVLFTNYKTYVVNVDNQGAVKGKNKAQGNKRVMYTTHHPCWDAKNRNGLADELSFDYSEIAHIPASRSESAPTHTVAADLAKPVAGFDGPATRVEPLPPEPEQPITAAEQLIMDNAPEPMDGVPKPLADLMAANGVTVAEIQQVVGMKGYYPADTPIRNYDPQFISGVLVAAWAQVYGAIEANREKAS